MFLPEAIWFLLLLEWAVEQEPVAAPVIASIAKSIGALVVGIVTKPFRWEGKSKNDEC